MGNYYLRQSATVAGTVPASAPYGLDLTLGSGLLGSANTRLIICQAVSGPGHGHNTAVVNGNTFPIDVGCDDSTGGFSTDISIYNVQAGDAGIKTISSRLTASYATSYMAAWVGEYTEIDQTNYGFSGNAKDSNNNVDYDSSYGGPTDTNWFGTYGPNISLSRANGNNCNYTPELSVWAIGGKAPLSVSGQSYLAEGYVTDNANVWLAVQDEYFNATGKFTATWTLSGSGYINAYNFTMKTLAYPIGSALANDLRESGFGVGAPGIRVAIR